MISPRNIKKIYKKYGILDGDVMLYGDSIAKIKISAIEKKESFKKIKASLILVTAISPTASGEGKTTVSIGLAQALNRHKVKTVLALREPSLGPVFGMKGGATGGGASQILPSDDINLHFTGDMHAITAANNLLAAALDNHIYFDNTLAIDETTIVFKRCIDMNDRALRSIFNITAASETMAIVCLSKNMSDLRSRISRIVVAQNIRGEYIYAKDLGVVGAILVLLKDAMLPNIVQTTEGTLAFVHGGPFANIAHGCNSLLATRAALAYSDVCITEAGFGADLGAEKFFDIKLRVANKSSDTIIWPSVVVLVATHKSIKSQGEGYDNIKRHIQNIQKFGAEVVVAVNVFEKDKKTDISNIIDFCHTLGIQAFPVNVYTKGSSGASEIAQYIKKFLNSNAGEIKRKYIYKNSDTLETKISKVAISIYGAAKVKYTEEAKEKITRFQKDFGKLPVCIAKNQYSFSDNPKILGAPSGHTLHITDAYVQNGAGFVTVLAGTVYTMPGLSKNPAAENIDLDANGSIKNLK